MLKKSLLLAGFTLALVACADTQPHVIQASTDASTINLTPGMVTQIEMPDQGHVQSINLGNPGLIDAQQAGDVVNLTAKGGAGETNMIIRAKGDSGASRVYQYHIIVQMQ